MSPSKPIAPFIDMITLFDKDCQENFFKFESPYFESPQFLIRYSIDFIIKEPKEKLEHCSAICKQ